jgi:ribosomal protein L11 methyltransferase
MKEYRYFVKNEELEEAFFDMELTVVEDDFRDGHSFIVYSDDDLGSVFKEYFTEFSVKDVADTGWEHVWKDFLKAGWLTDSIYYCFEEQEDAPEKTIQIIPALAFGTGTHATTQAAARLLEPVADGRVTADIGCGTGILAIAAKFSGAPKVYACDIDALALGNTRDNMALNSCADIEVFEGSADALAGRGIQLAVANIITSVLNDIHSDVLALRPEYIVYSGILASEFDEFVSGLELDGYEKDGEITVNEWKGVRFRRCWE